LPPARGIFWKKGLQKWSRSHLVITNILKVSKLDEKFLAENLKIVPETFKKDIQNFTIDKKIFNAKFEFFLENLKNLNVCRFLS